MKECVISKVLLRPEERPLYIRQLLDFDGMSGVEEIPDLAYCAQPLTDLTILENQFSAYNFQGAQAYVKVNIEEIKSWHNSLKDYMKKSGMQVYDPGEVTHPKIFISQPQITPTQGPRTVFDIDVTKVLQGRVFEYTNLWGSTGAGIEESWAVRYNKIPFVVVKKDKYASRMGTGHRRTIVVAVDNVQNRERDLVSLFKKTSSLDSGIGTCENHGNTLLLFEDGKPLCGDAYIHEMYPQLEFEFEKTIPK